jgi:hypothetical protein
LVEAVKILSRLSVNSSGFFIFRFFSKVLSFWLYSLPMMQLEEVNAIALAFEGAEAKPHFQLVSYRFKDRIFATLDSERSRVMIKLSLIDQSLFVNGEDVYPVPNAWGAKGATYFELKTVRRRVFEDAMRAGYGLVAAGKRR